MKENTDQNPDVTAATAVPGSIVSRNESHAEPVLVFEAASQEEAEVALATLEATGIHAFLENPNPSAGAGRLAESVGVTWRAEVFVAPSDAEAARAVLNAPSLTEAELTEEEETDPTSLEEAEKRMRSSQ